jgi:hypothetical protein
MDGQAARNQKEGKEMSDFHEDDLMKNEGDDVEAHDFLKDQDDKREVLKDDEGDDVEAHSVMGGSAMGGSALGGSALGGSAMDSVMRDSDDDKRSDVL